MQANSHLVYELIFASQAYYRLGLNDEYVRSEIRGLLESLVPKFK